MRGTIRGVADHRCESLTAWELCSTPPDSVTTPATLEAAAPSWMAAKVPNTVAACLRELGKWSLAAGARRFDADDWWFRCRFDASAEARSEERIVLGFDGLASVAEIWLN